VKTRGAAGAGLLMGLAFVFKFSAAIFFVGFAAWLLVERRWRDAALASAGFLAPFAFVNVADGFRSAYFLLASGRVQAGYSTWSGVVFKLFSTGLIAAAALSVAAAARERTARTRLLLFVPGAYFVYVVANRDAHAASFVMMHCMVYSAFLLATFVPSALRGGALAVVLAAYASAGIAVTHHNLYRDTDPVEVLRDPKRIEREFRLRADPPGR
jgi:hypothetical protein